MVILYIPNYFDMYEINEKNTAALLLNTYRDDRYA